MSITGEILNYSSFYLFDQTLPVTVEVMNNENETEKDEKNE